MKPRVMMVSHSLSVRDYHGGCAYAAAILEELHAAGCEILHLWLADLRGRRPFRLPQVPVGGSVVVPGTLSARRWLLPLPGPAMAFPAFIDRMVGRYRPVMAILDRAPMMEIWPNGSECPAWVLTIDSIHQRKKQYQEHGYATDFTTATESEEARLLRKADGIIAIQDEEAEEFRRLAPSVPVITVPHPVRPDPLPEEDSVPGTLLFVGGSSAHNVDGLHWFVAEVLPRVLMECPGAVLEIAGAVAESAPDHPAIRKLGHVADLRPLYARAQVCLAPLRFGTGLKIKVIEAMGYGRAVAATPVAAEGFADLSASLGACDGHVEGLADGVVSMLRDSDRRRQAMERQLDWVRCRVAPEVAIAPLLDALQVC